MKESAFVDILADYDLYHEANLQFFDKFYHDAVKKWEKIDLLKEDFLTVLKWNIHFKISDYQYRSRFFNLISSKMIYFSWNSKKEALELQIDLTDEEISVDDLNSSSDIKGVIKKGLSNVYRYQGEFRFADLDFDDIPF